MTIHREGYKYILIASAIWAIIGFVTYKYLLVDWPILFWPINVACFLLWFWVIWFFRLPERDFTYNENLYVDVYKRQLKHRTTKPTHNCSVLNCNDFAEAFCYLVKQFFVQWFSKAHVVMRRAKAFSFQLLASLYCKIARVAYC